MSAHSLLRLDEAVGHHQLRGGDGGGAHAEVMEHRGEIQRVPGFHGHELRAEFDDLLGFHVVEQDAVEDRPADGFGGPFGAFGELGDVGDPGGGLRREGRVQQPGLAVHLVLDGLGEEVRVARGQGVAAEGGDHPLARLALRIAISLNELQQRRALDLFGAEIHVRKIPEKAGGRQDKSFMIRHYILTLKKCTH